MHALLVINAILLVCIIVRWLQAEYKLMKFRQGLIYKLNRFLHRLRKGLIKP